MIDAARKTDGTFAKKHGYFGTRTYQAWANMKDRCHGPSSAKFEYYGGRGISVCKRWRESFEAFLQDVGECPPGLTIERLNTNGNYEPGNVVWATRKQQQNNRRTPKNGRMLTHDGITRHLREWSRIVGIHPNTIFQRLARGWDESRALTEPAKKGLR